MSWNRRHAGLAALLSVALGTTGCTIVKPLTGALTGPVYVVAGLGGVGGGCGCGDGRAVVAVLGASAVIGAVAGLVTGVISDFQVLFGVADDPTRNWWNPFATNTMSPH